MQVLRSVEFEPSGGSENDEENGDSEQMIFHYEITNIGGRQGLIGYNTKMNQKSKQLWNLDFADEKILAYGDNTELRHHDPVPVHVRGMALLHSFFTDTRIRVPNIEMLFLAGRGKQPLSSLTANCDATYQYS